MKYFKTQAVRTARRYIITPDVFNEITKRKYPYEQINEQGQLSQYGICPSCLNPIQLIGVVKKTNRVYGKHTGKNVSGLSEWEQINYEYCPFASKNIYRQPNDDEWLTEVTENVIELYNLLKEQLDRVVYILEKELCFRGSRSFWKKSVSQFLTNNAYLYPWLTEANLPYIFAYFGVTHQRVFNQKFKTDSEVYKVLSERSDTKFVDCNNGYSQLTNSDGHFLNLFFRFWNHTHKISEDETLFESMSFCIDDRDTGKTVYEKNIEFSETYFMNLINKPDKEDKRQHWLLEIAEELMTGIG